MSIFSSNIIDGVRYLQVGHAKRYSGRRRLNVQSTLGEDLYIVTIEHLTTSVISLSYMSTVAQAIIT